MGTLVEITRFYDPEEAFCARGFLMSRGIDTIMGNEYHLTMAPWLRIALGGYRLMAPSELKEQSMQALNEVSALNIQDDPAEPMNKSRPNWLWLPVAIGTAAPFLPTRKTGLIGAFQFSVLAMIYSTIIMMFATWIVRLF